MEVGHLVWHFAASLTPQKQSQGSVAKQHPSYEAACFRDSRARPCQYQEPSSAGGSGGEDEEEAEYMSSGGSSSGSDDDEEEEGEGGIAAEPDSAAQQRALEEARAMLADRPRSRKKRSNAWFEEEVPIALVVYTSLFPPMSTELRLAAFHAYADGSSLLHACIPSYAPVVMLTVVGLQVSCNICRISLPLSTVCLTDAG